MKSTIMVRYWRARAERFFYLEYPEYLVDALKFNGPTAGLLIEFAMAARRRAAVTGR